MGDRNGNLFIWCALIDDLLRARGPEIVWELCLPCDLAVVELGFVVDVSGRVLGDTDGDIGVKIGLCGPPGHALLWHFRNPVVGGPSPHSWESSWCTFSEMFTNRQNVAVFERVYRNWSTH